MKLYNVVLELWILNGWLLWLFNALEWLRGIGF